MHPEIATHEVVDEGREFYVCGAAPFSPYVMPKADYEPIPEPVWEDVTGECRIIEYDSLLDDRPSAIMHHEASGNSNNILYRLGPESRPQYRLMKVPLFQGGCGLRVERKR